MPNNSRFVVMWDCNGLEAIEAIPDESAKTFAVLANKPLPAMPAVNHWMLRARYNSQRHYEIYVIETTDGIDKQDILEMFEASPQTAADTIRRLGNCLYSDRYESNKVTIS